MSRVPYIFSRYMIRHFLLSVGIVFAAMASLIMLIDAEELLRRVVSKSVPLYLLAEMIILKFPMLSQKTIPFAVLIGTVLTFTRLSRSQEMVIARSSGISVWQFLAPAIITSFLMGLIIIAVINPISCAMLARYERIEDRLFAGRANVMSVSKSGLWLKQKEADGGETIIHSMHASSLEGNLNQAILFFFSPEGKFIKRVDADHALLDHGVWKLDKVTLTPANQDVQRMEHADIPTTLTLEQIQESFASPETLSFWALPGFIQTLQEAGFSALRHQLYYRSLLVLPFFLSAMVLVGALFSLSVPRFAKTSRLMGGSVLTGFLIYFINDIVSAFGLSGSIPLSLAAFAPIAIITLISLGFLLHLEDG